MELTFIITAGGIGKRMGENLPKQLLLLHGKAIVWHTMNRLFSSFPKAQYIIATPKDYFQEMNAALENFAEKVTLIEGGVERFDSVKNALAYANGHYIAVHDAVRPFIASSCLNLLIDEVKRSKAVVPAIPLVDSLRKVIKDSSIHMERSIFRSVQTPQIFEAQLLKKAYSQSYQMKFTDDASVVESMGVKIILVDGNEENIKITTPKDLYLAQYFLDKKDII